MSKFERISTFISVVDENGFAAAARKKSLSKAGISRQIAALEHELGVELLKRTTRKIALTEVGNEYYQQCKKILAQLQESETAIAGSQKEATGLLSIVSTPHFALIYIFPKLAEFMKLNPKLQIRFDLAERFPDLGKEEIDVLFGVSVDGPPELTRRRITSTRYILCASPDYLKKYGVPQVPADMLKHRYITHSIRRPDNVIPFKDDKKIYVNPYLWLNDSRVMRECAINHMGIIRVHDYMVMEALQKKQLIEILSEFQEPPQSVYLYFQQSRFLQSKIRKFIDFFVDNVRE
jgi:DNA-binding transcriptional LysR family regulator